MILLLLDARNRWKLFVSCLNEEQTQCRHALIKLCTNKHWISACCKQTASILIKFFRCELAAHDLRVFLSALQRGMMALIMPGSWFGGTEMGSLNASERRQKYKAQAVAYAVLNKDQHK